MPQECIWRKRPSHGVTDGNCTGSFTRLIIQTRFLTLRNVYVSTRAPTKLLKQELEPESYTRRISTEVCVDSGMRVFNSKCVYQTKLSVQAFANQEVLQTAHCKLRPLFSLRVFIYSLFYSELFTKEIVVNGESVSVAVNRGQP